MRRSSTSQNNTQINRRSSSADNFGSSQQNRPSMGRSSSIGRPSMGTLKPNEAKPVNPHELAQSVLILLEALEYSEQLSVKSLLLPSTATFYNIFEFLLKTIGIHDVWNPNLLPQQTHGKNQNQAISSSQPQQSSIAQNKARLELIIHHLTFLKYNNVPKPNVFQTMTTPKNWTSMLQILYFLCNNVKFLQIYDATKIVNTCSYENQEFINEYLKNCYAKVISKGKSYLTSDEYKKFKEDSLKQFEKQLRLNADLKQLESERDNCLKTYEHLNSQRNDFDNLLQEEQELLRLINEEESGLNQELIDLEDRIKRVHMNKNEVQSLKEKLQKSEEEMTVKDAQYDKQLSSGKQIDNLPIKHAQKAQELENLQNLLVELDNEKDELYIKLNQKSQEAKTCINKSNELVNKIKLSSLLQLNNLPHLELVDFHKNNNFIKEYKECILQIRKDYNSDICKLPSQLSQCKEERKLTESKIESSKISIKNLEKEIKSYEKLLKDLQISSEEAINNANRKVKMTKNDLIESENQLKQMKDRLSHCKEELKKSWDEYKKIDSETNSNIKECVENLDSNKKELFEELESCQRQIKSELLNNRNVLSELNIELKNFIKSKPLKSLKI